MAEMRQDLFSWLDSEGLGSFADELLRVGLVPATQLYEVGELRPGRLLLVPSLPRLGQLAGGLGGGNEPPSLRRRAKRWKV